MTQSSLLKKAIGECDWFFYRVKSSKHDSYYHGREVLDHALYCGYITGEQFEKLDGKLYMHVLKLTPYIS